MEEIETPPYLAERSFPSEQLAREKHLAEFGVSETKIFWEASDFVWADTYTNLKETERAHSRVITRKLRFSGFCGVGVSVLTVFRAKRKHRN